MSVGTAVIDIENLHASYRMPSGRTVTAIDGLSLSVNRGEVVGFIGPNGAGKTTTIKILMGFLQPTQGKAHLFGEKAGSIAARRRIGYLPEVALYYPFLSARETLRLYAKLADIPRACREETVLALLEQVGLHGRDRERLSGFSKGMLQRVGIAQAIMGEPDLLILDEVTSGLDPVARHDVRRILMEFKAAGKTVFFSSHELSEVALLCDRIVLLDEGKILEESTLRELTASTRCVVVRTRHTGQTFDGGGIVARVLNEDSQVYTAASWNKAQELQKRIEASGGEVLEIFEESMSLEDYFVCKLGHKVA